MPGIRIVRLLVVAAAVVCSSCDGQRGVRPPDRVPRAKAGAFDPRESAALFVGVRQFSKDSTLADVRYAVDDAVDLAFVLSLEGRRPLVEPTRVLLALSGEPQKPESRERLAKLVAEGARTRRAEQADVINALEEQANAAGDNGMFIVAFATHGVSYDGTQYLLASTSVLRHRETAISENKIRDIASLSDAGRSLILVDACREQLTTDQRSGTADDRSAASLIEAMSGTIGQVVLSAAAAGQFAYDDNERRNGVFTAAVIDGIRCGAPTDPQGLVTVETLAAFVEQQVRTWIRKHRDRSIASATQMAYAGGARSMPLAACRGAVTTVRRPTCTISIASSPAGATVSIQDVDVGATPMSIVVAEGKSAQVDLAKTGFKDVSVAVDCQSGRVMQALVAVETPIPDPVDLRRSLEASYADGARLKKIFDPNDRDGRTFVDAYLEWRRRNEELLRAVDRRSAAQKRRGGETVRFLEKADKWCATSWPPPRADEFTEAEGELFRESSRAQRCRWDLTAAMDELNLILMSAQGLSQGPS